MIARCGKSPLSVKLLPERLVSGSKVGARQLFYPLKTVSLQVHKTCPQYQQEWNIR